MEALFEALRSAISAAGDYGIWIGILAFFMVLGYGFRKKSDEHQEHDEVIQERIARNKFIGGRGAILIFVFLFWYVLS